MAILVILSVSSSSFRFPAFDIFNGGDGGGNYGLFFLRTVRESLLRRLEKWKRRLASERFSSEFQSQPLSGYLFTVTI